MAAFAFYSLVSCIWIKQINNTVTSLGKTLHATYAINKAGKHNIPWHHCRNKRRHCDANDTSLRRCDVTDWPCPADADDADADERDEEDEESERDEPPPEPVVAVPVFRRHLHLAHL